MKMNIVCRGLGIALILMVGYAQTNSAIAQKMDKAAFYAAMTSGTMEDITKELAILNESEQGYTGALIIRKAALVPKAKDKLKLFKEGRIKLETAILNEPENAEYRFLRLTIEEKAPKIVKYKADLEPDKQFVIKHFDKLSPVVQRAVKDYTKNSKILKPADL